jgi:hypothetical protein
MGIGMQQWHCEEDLAARVKVAAITFLSTKLTLIE